MSQNSEIRKCLDALSYPFLNVTSKTSKAPASLSGDKSSDALAKAQLADKMETELNELKLQEMARHLITVDLKYQQFFLDDDRGINDVAAAKDTLQRKQSGVFGGIKVVRLSGKSTLILLLVESLEKRFKFHFFGNRKTNNLDKVDI